MMKRGSTRRVERGSLTGCGVSLPRSLGVRKQPTPAYWTILLIPTEWKPVAGLLRINFRRRFHQAVYEVHLQRLPLILEVGCSGSYGPLPSWQQATDNLVRHW